MARLWVVCVADAIVPGWDAACPVSTMTAMARPAEVDPPWVAVTVNVVTRLGRYGDADRDRGQGKRIPGVHGHGGVQCHGELERAASARRPERDVSVNLAVGARPVRPRRQRPVSG